MVNEYGCHFAFERLELKGKLSYGHLAGGVEVLGSLEGFLAVRVSVAGTSQTCPVCGHRDRRNRNGEEIRCVGCGFSAQADVVGAVNIAMRVG